MGCLCFTANTANSTIKLSKYGSVSWVGSYSTDGTTWTSYTLASTITLPTAGSKIYMKGDIQTNTSESRYLYFTMTGSIAASGNVYSLYDETDYETTLNKVWYGFYHMFYQCTSLTTPPELPRAISTETYNDVYTFGGMFARCTSLRTLPSLPYTTVSKGCYGSMFLGCTSITTPPLLPATTAVNLCYQDMFNGCTSLASAPVLPATTITGGFAYEGMFEGCTSLLQPPALPATSLTGSGIYQFMFSNSGITYCPVLPATTLPAYTYYAMFEFCTGITLPPYLPATSLGTGAYYGMFVGCTSLKIPAQVPALTIPNYAYYIMYNGCTSIKLSTTRTSEYDTEYRIPTSGTGTGGTSCLYNMFAGTGGTFTGTPTINTTYYYAGYVKKINKVMYSALALIDLTSDTVTPNNVRSGVTFHMADGQPAVGTNSSIASGGVLPTVTNRSVNKVIYRGNTLIDLTSDTITPSDVISGITFHAANGKQYTGTA